MKKYIVLSVIVVMGIVSAISAAQPKEPNIGVGALSINGAAYGQISMLWDYVDAGIVFRGEAYDKAGGSSNTSLTEFGIKAGMKQYFNDDQKLTYGILWTLFSGKKDGNDLTGGMAFAPYVGLQQKVYKNLVLDIAYYPFYSAGYASGAGDIKEFKLNLVSAGLTYVFN